MNTLDYITHYGIQWGTYPYYQGSKYDKLGVYFVSFGGNNGIPYGVVQENFSFSSDDSSKYLSMFRNGGLKEYYGENIFQQKNYLVSRDDFIRNTDPIFAIPTEKELQKLLDYSYKHVIIGPNSQVFLIIEPYEMKDGVKKIVGEIYIPLLGCVNYNGDSYNPDIITKYTTSNSEIKKFLWGDVVKIPLNSNKQPPYGYTYGGVSEGYKVYYESYYTYSDIFLLTSDIPKDDNGEILKQPDEYGKTYARVLKITIESEGKVYDAPSDPDLNQDDFEFLSFKIKKTEFENKICGWGVSNTKDTAYMVLPIRREGNINVNIKGELLINNHAFSTFNQNANTEDIPYVKILPFGIPEIIKGEYNYTFLKNISDKENELSTYFNFPNGTTKGMSYFNTIEYLDTTRVKITNTDEGNTYWTLSNNDCLYVYSNGSRKYMVFDGRVFFSSDDKSTTINISINFNYNDPYIIQNTRFVLPSIYKPFYIKRLYCIESYYAKYDGGYQCMYSFASHTNVYNGIGLFAQKGESEINYISTVSSNSNVNNVSNNSLSTNGKINSSSLNDLPSKLKILLDSYFDGDNTFSKEYSYFYDTFKTEDLYAIGLLNDTIELRNSDNKIIKSVLSPLPIFRNKPLILSDYNDSVYDFFEYIIHNEYESNKNQTNIYVGNEFTSVMEPYTKLRFNEERIKVDYRLDFGDLFNKIHLVNCGANTIENYPKCINNFDSVVKILKNQQGIRYYFVNQAFYDNYIINWVNEESTSEFIVYKQEYYNNREYYDLNPHKVDFKHNHIWDSSFGNEEYTLDTDEMKNYIPFFDMIPSLRNTKGYAYSDGDDFPNHKAPIALELYLSKNEKMLLFNPNQDCSTGSNTLDNISNYKPLYLIGASTPLTRLEGACTDPDSAYVKHIKDNTELLPQMDSTSIIYSYGMVEEHNCKGYDKQIQ